MCGIELFSPKNRVNEPHISGEMGPALSSVIEAVNWSVSDEPPMPASVGSLRLSAALRQKLGHGVRINIKLLIRGDARSGKTACFRRIQGLGFTADLAPPKRLDATTIDWAFDDAQEDRVKVEVHDVVDQDLRRPCSGSVPQLQHQGTSKGVRALQPGRADTALPPARGARA